MKKNNIVLFGIAVLCACSVPKERQPLTGGQWGEIKNGSAEEVVSSEVLYWQAPPASKEVLHFYDATAHDGTRSLCISADGLANGYWNNRVNLKPWSKYRFKGWIKCENVVAEPQGGAGFRLQGVEVQLPDFTGTQDWTLVSCDFETGANDCVTVSCLLGTEGKAKGKVWFDDLSFECLGTEVIETSIKVDPAEQKAEMSPYIYGQFIEHMGHCIYGGIWAEMLMDRKFWYAPGQKGSPWQIADTDKAEEGLYMDETAPYTGRHTPVLKSDGKRIALKQTQLGLRPGISCSGYIVMKADREMPVKVMLNYGSFIQELSLEVGTTYRKYPVHFSAFDHKVKDATFSICPQKEGRLWIGTASLMPDDHIDGFRADVLALLRGLKAPVYRWPGGNFVSGYDWHDGIGERDKRPPRRNPAWTGVESNDVGIHEFMRLCELLDTEPYIAVNAGLGGVKEAADEVEYCNGAEDTPMGKWRKQNGQAKPWKVKWWSVGNEMFGDWQLGFMSTEAFVKKHNSFADAMWKVDSSIHLIAVGEVGRWDEMILANCADRMDLVSEHFYCQDWHGGGLMTHVLQIPRNIRRIAEAHRGYRRDIPALEGKDIRICMDEWNYWYGPHIYGELGTRYFLRDALGIAAGLNEFLRQSDMVFMANYAQTVNVIGCIKATTTDACYASTGEVLKLYREQFGTVPVKVDGELRPLDVAAAIRSSDQALTLSVINPGWEEVTFELDILGGQFEYQEKTCRLNGVATIYTLTGPDDMAYNTPGQESVVKVSEKSLKNTKQVKVGPFSANVIVLGTE